MITVITTILPNPSVYNNGLSLQNPLTGLKIIRLCENSRRHDLVLLLFSCWVVGLLAPASLQRERLEMRVGVGNF